MLGGYTSAVLMIGVAAYMGYESIARLIEPRAIQFDEAIVVAVVGLGSAYLHVVADAATSVLAIIALAGGKYFGATSLDPIMGLAGMVLVGRWALGLLRDTGRVLLDAEMDAPVVAEVRDVVAGLPGTRQVRVHRQPRRRRRAAGGGGAGSVAGARGTRARDGRDRARPLTPFSGGG